MADVELLRALKLLNKAGLVSDYHCSEAHAGSDAFRLKKKHRPCEWCRGPYIILKYADSHMLKIFEDKAKEFNSNLPSATRIDVESELHENTSVLGGSTSEMRLTVTVYCSDWKEPDLKDACNVMTEFVSSVVKELGDTYADTRGDKLRRSANDTNILFSDI